MVRRLSLLTLLLAMVIGSAQGQRKPAHAQAPNSSGPLVTLPNHTLKNLPAAAGLPQSPSIAGGGPDSASNQPITVTIVLNRTDQSAFEAFWEDIENPSSPNFDHFLTQTDLANRFGPSQQTYDAVLSYLQGYGLTLVDGSSNRLTLTVRGTRAAAEKAFNVSIKDYQVSNHAFHANTADPAVPAGVASSIHAVVGLSNLARPHASAGQTQPLGAASSGGLSPASPASIATAYNFGSVGADGAGQKIGIMEFDNFNRSDINSWLTSQYGPCSSGGSSCASATMKRLSEVDVNGGTPVCGGGSTPCDNETEVLEDVDTAIGMATGATYVVYDAPNDTTTDQQILNAMIGDGDTVISNSWSYCEDQTDLSDVASIDSILQSAAASGITVYSATGDSGAPCVEADGSLSANVVSVPGDAPHGTAVGGTNLQVGAGNSYQSETWWNGSCTTGPCSGSFGASTFFKLPSYQSGFTKATGRSVPDVSADSDPTTGIVVYQGDHGGFLGLRAGTSLAAPAWAAGTAILNQKLGHLTGNLNQVLYAHASDGSFHTASSMGSDFAHVGLGSFNLGSLAAALAAGSPLPLPTSSPVPTATVKPGTIITYSAGWNLVGGPAGTVFTGAAASLFTFQANDVNYETVAATTPLQANSRGFWAFFAAPSTVTLPLTTAQPVTVSLPPNQFVMVGNPTDGPVTLKGADTVYTYNAAQGQYVNSTTLNAGQGAWVFSRGGGTLTLTP